MSAPTAPAVSENGWQLLDADTAGQLPHLRRWTVPGADRALTLRDGAAGFVLVHLATVFHRRIEPLAVLDPTWDDWGWAPRPIRGGTKPSNHGSGTAEDLNATRHPLGTAPASTFTAAQVRKIRRHLATTYAGCIRWGGDYHGRPDPMHFELAPGTTLPQVEQLARQLGGTAVGRLVRRANPDGWAVVLR